MKTHFVEISFWHFDERGYFCKINEISRLPCIPFFVFSGWIGMGQVTAKRTLKPHDRGHVQVHKNKLYIQPHKYRFQFNFSCTHISVCIPDNVSRRNRTSQLLPIYHSIYIFIYMPGHSHVCNQRNCESTRQSIRM